MNRQTPAVAVLLATYNGERYLREQIDSVLAQTVHDFVLYISDDGSTDGTLQILRGYASRDSRVRLLCDHEPTGSSCANFLYLLDHADADLFCLCDQDDVWTPDHVEVLVTEYERLSDADRGKPFLAHGDLSVVDENLSLIAPSMFEYSRLPRNPQNSHFYFVQNNVTGCVTLINRALKDAVFRNRGELYSRLDVILMHDILFATVAVELGIRVMVPECIEHYRQHGGNVLGARKAGGLSVLLRKVFSPSAYRESFVWYKSILERYEAFAGFFAEYFKDMLDPAEYDCLICFSRIRSLSKLKRIAFARRNGFVKFGLVRNIWQWIVI